MSDHFLALSVSQSFTESLCCWDLTYVTPACEYAEFTQILHADVELSNLLNKVVTCTSGSFSKQNQAEVWPRFWIILHWTVEFVKVITGNCQSCYMYFTPFAKQNDAEIWPRFQSLLKVLLWTRGVNGVKALNALGPLCLWQCLL